MQGLVHGRSTPLFERTPGFPGWEPKCCYPRRLLVLYATTNRAVFFTCLLAPLAVCSFLACGLLFCGREHDQPALRARCTGLSSRGSGPGSGTIKAFFESAGTAFVGTSREQVCGSLANRQGARKKTMAVGVRCAPLLRSFGCVPVAFFGCPFLGGPQVFCPGAFRQANVAAQVRRHHLPGTQRRDPWS